MSIHIVIYEDNPFLRSSLILIINTHASFKVVAAFENCDNVLKEMQEFKPQIVLMDIGMSGTNGIDGLKIIKQHFPSIHVMMITVFEDNDHIFDAICLGASGYLLKNTPLEKITEAIEDLLNGGAPMTPSVARKVIHLFKNLAVPKEKQYGLSSREKEVLQLLTKGYSYKMIAEECYISVETVRSHIKKIYEKLQVHSATEAISKVLNRN